MPNDKDSCAQSNLPGQQASLALRELNVLSEIGVVPSSLTKKVLKAVANLVSTPTGL